MNRARSAQAKQVRREQILHAAVDLLLDVPYDQVTMAQVAGAAGLAKGTPYLYWESREELFLSALQAEYGELLATLTREVPALPTDPEGLAAALARAVTTRTRLVTMVGLMHVVLEAHAPAAAVIAFKREMARGVMGLAAVLHTHLGWLSIEAAARLLLRLHGAIVSFCQMSSLSDSVREALAEAPDLALMQVDFERDLRELVHDLLIAARVRGSGHG
ncbi:MAG: TetR family transcriptional regulator [Myxococcota bacterium]